MNAMEEFSAEAAPATPPPGATDERKGGAVHSPAPQAQHPLGRMTAGFGLLFEGFGVLRRERSLWSLALVPFVFSGLAATLAMFAVYANAAELFALIEAGLPLVEVDAWYQWIWLGPLKAGLWLLGYLLFALAAGFSLVLSILLATLAASPFLDALSYRTEQLVSGAVAESGDSGVGALVRDARRSVLNDAQRLMLFIAIWGVLLGAGLLIPGAVLITGPLMALVTVLFLPLDYAAYALDRRRVSFRARRRWLRAQLPRMLGFGAAAFLACFVPVVNLLMIPALVVAGTLLVLRHPPTGRAD
jgi:CysZ protein